MWNTGEVKKGLEEDKEEKKVSDLSGGGGNE